MVFGANGATGRLVAAMAVAAGHSVTAIARRPREFPFYDRGLQVAEVDVRDAEAVDWVVAGHDAVISVIGVPPTRRPVTVYSEGTAHIVRSMAGHGTRRLVCVSSAGLDPGAGSGSGPGRALWRREVRRRVFQARMLGVHRDMGRMEDIVRGSALDWTLVRAGRLIGVSPTDYRTSPHALPGAWTSRGDLAHLLLRRTVRCGPVRDTVYVTSSDRR
ncbi:NAD(P)-dependent oxidoreductase (plasmid) [Streptomyces sp. CWNU-52B]|uniref:NAD(P)-dependent oxidoreductase n=1 Tax=unclassified Streptomyces TaxID=2593676 RepID=UPI0039C4CAF5